MKRILGILSMAMAMLFAVSGANAAPVIFNQSPGDLDFAGSAVYTDGALPHSWQLNLSGFSGPVGLLLAYSTQNVWQNFGVQLCDTDNCSNPAIGSLSGIDYPDLTLLAGGLTNGTYYMVFNGTLINPNSHWSYSLQGAVTPIPGALLLFGSGLAALGAAGRVGRRSRKKSSVTA